LALHGDSALISIKSEVDLMRAAVRKNGIMVGSSGNGVLARFEELGFIEIEAMLLGQSFPKR
jgi:hypothetical protein